MLPTWFLSMWISNTATTAMMMPIAMEVIEKLKEANNQKADEEDTSNFKGILDINILIPGEYKCLKYNHKVCRSFLHSVFKKI